MRDNAQRSDTAKLQATVANIHSVSLEALAHMAALARTLEAAEKAPNGLDAESRAGVLQVIWRDAERLADLITAEAELVGCSAVA